MPTPDDVSRYVVELQTDNGKGLGVVVRDHILTCAHLFDIIKGSRELMLSVTATIRGETKPSDYYVQTLDCLLDFMVLGYNPVFQEITSDAQFGLEEIEPCLNPVALVFPDGLNDATIPVYFFLPDGQTPVQATATVSRHSPDIFIDAISQAGCSGGPIFTADHHLIGIFQARYSVAGKGLNESHAIRIDLAATEWLRRDLGGFRPLNLAD